MKAAIDQIFDRYDTDKSGSLEKREIEKMMRDVWNKLSPNCRPRE